MDRYWLLTSTTYGTWLPGDPRGFVGPVRLGAGGQVVHNVPGTEYDRDLPDLKRFASDNLKCAPIRLTQLQADALHYQFHETASHRGWRLSAVGIMTTHVHIVVGVLGDPDPDRVLGDFKAYGSRVLNRNWKRPKSGTWWTESGSKRKLPDDDAVLAAVEYVRHQPNPLVVWIAGEVPPPLKPDWLK